MTIKQQGGIFGRNPTFNEVHVDTKLTTSDLIADQVGVGVSSPTLPFQLKAPSSGAATVASFGNINITDGLQVTTNGNLDWGFNALNSRSFTVSTNQTERLRVAGTGSGDVTVSTGNLVIGTSGKGIDFSATSGTGTSELFDDYEEGTFSPVFADAISGGNLASTSNTYAQYTKVGNVVHCTISMLNINTTGLTAGNTAYIQGLPFATVSAGTSRFFPIYVRADGITSTVGIQGWILANAVTYIGLEDVTTTGKANLLVSAISSGVSDLAVSFSYFTS